MEGKKYIAAALLAGFVLGSSQVPAQAAGLLGKILTGGAVGAVVNYSASTINSAINTVLAQNNVASTYATKVVPIISIGDGSRVGAAQVSGPQEQIDLCQAALQIQPTLLGVRFTALIPVDRVAITDFSRVQGVGVSAQIDIKL